MSTSSSVVFNDVSFHWPDGSAVLSHATNSFSNARTGLIGANGVGKTTVLRLIVGDLQPTSGTITCNGVVDYLRQDVTRGASTVADLLGIQHIRNALRAIEAGSTEHHFFDVIGDDWDIEERAIADLSSLNLPVDLDRSVLSLSGGEVMLTAITGIRLRGADIALLDEPTNNLDLDTRQRLYDVIQTWQGTLIVVSHDLDLLDQLDATAELRDAQITTFGGPYSEYKAAVDVQQAAAMQSLRNAEQILKREKRERIKAEERIAHSKRQGRKDRDNSKYVAAVINDRRNSAEKSQGSRRSGAEDKINAAKQAVTDAERVVRDDENIIIDLPDPNVPNGRRIAELPSNDGRKHIIQGSERIAIIGANGVGKTTMIEKLLPHVSSRIGYLPQRITLDDSATVLDVIREEAPNMSSVDLRNQLARLLIRGDMVDRSVETLSGGERFRVALARLLLADPPPEFLVLDEPTNDLDIPSVDHLIAALNAYRGALLLVSHDMRFLQRLNLDHILRLDSDGVLSDWALE